MTRIHGSTTYTTPAFALVVAAITVGAIWTLGLAAPNVRVHGAYVGAFVALAAGALLVLGRRAPGLRTAGLVSLGATMVLALAVGGVLSRSKTVDEQVVTATRTVSDADAPARETATAPSRGNVQVASGRFATLEHHTEGTARVIQLGDGSAKLTLQGFRTDPGPDLRVIAVAGDPKTDSDVEDFVDLGPLKGNEGDQQYSLPADFDAARYDHVYIWCRAFSVGFGRAALTP